MTKNNKKHYYKHKQSKKVTLNFSVTFIFYVT